MTKHITFIRHAKSGYPPDTADHDRPLNPRGQRNLARMRSWLLQLPTIDFAWISTATRAQETATGLLTGVLSDQPEHRVSEPALYLAAPSTLLNIAARTPDTAAHAVIIAHNPGITDTVNRLASTPFTDNVVTCGCVTFAVSSFADISSATATLVAYRFPKHPELQD